MATLHVEIPVPFEVSIDEAKRRMRGLLGHIERMEMPGVITEPEEAWDEGGYNEYFSFKAKGNTINGSMKVGHNFIVIDGNLPFFAGFFKGKITEVIKKHATELLTAA